MAQHEDTQAFLLLPVECIASIFSFLQCEELALHVCGVCELWRVALAHPLSWSEIELSRSKLVPGFLSLVRAFPVMFGPRSCVRTASLVGGTESDSGYEYTWTEDRCRHLQSSPRAVLRL